jgi:hypothetical protein
MRKGLGFLLVIASLLIVGAIAAVSLRADYWILSPREKFLRSWQEDVLLLQKSNKLPQGWSHIRTVEVKSDNSPARDWVDDLKKRVPTDPTGTYKLSVMAIHWIEENRYGAIIQYNLVDTKSGNTVWELSRTFKLGYIL